ncbi:MAG: biotin carboxylase N-terminal domain-containing protein, partial [Myxococcota bacterium]|nr:biotin carboxylase N-terminal domain-containing protein [Myxococcota bacterium]
MSEDHDLRRLLAACRGEAALRIRRAAAREGLEVVGLIDPARDQDPLWAGALDGAAIVPPDTRGRWPAVEAAVAAAIDAGCDAVYPGWG